MPAQSALRIIEDALGLTNAVGTDQTLTADEQSDCLRLFNDMVDSWSTMSLAVYGTANQTFNTINGQATYTIGPLGDWNTDRPQDIHDPAYSVINGVTFQCTPMTQAEYNRIPIKGQVQQFPLKYLFVNDYPLARVTLWPVPNAVTPLTFSIDRLLTQPATVATTVNFPPGYSLAFKYNLAILLAPGFNTKISEHPDVATLAVSSLANIKRANKKQRVMTIDPAYSDHPGDGFSQWWRGY